jgi:hypothetical protein
VQINRGDLRGDIYELSRSLDAARVSGDDQVLVRDQLMEQASAVAAGRGRSTGELLLIIQQP